MPLPSDLTKVKGLRWHRLSLTADERFHHNRMPITALNRIPLDLAPTSSIRELQQLLAELEYHHEIGPDQVTLRQGYAGAKTLRQAIARHTPQLAETRSDRERAFIHLLNAKGLQLPRINHPAGLSTVDAIFSWTTTT